MKKFISISTLILILCCLSISCGKDSDRIDYTLDDLQENKYYESEIFNEINLDIYGKWKLYSVSGGIHGGGHELNFDVFEVRKFGIYGFIKDSRILEYGKIRIDDPTGEELLITLVPDDSSETFMYDSEKYLNFTGHDTLILRSPCCDRYDYHFKRIK